MFSDGVGLDHTVDGFPHREGEKFIFSGYFLSFPVILYLKNYGGDGILTGCYRHGFGATSNTVSKFRISVDSWCDSPRRATRERT